MAAARPSKKKPHVLLTGRTGGVRWLREAACVIGRASQCSQQMQSRTVCQQMQKHTSMQSNQGMASKLLPFVKGRNRARVTTASKHPASKASRRKNAHTEGKGQTALHSKEYNQTRQAGCAVRQQPLQCVPKAARYKQQRGRRTALDESSRKERTCAFWLV